MTKVEQIQAEIDNKNAAIEQEAANGQQTNHEQIIQWRNEINLLQMQLSDAKAEEAQQSERVQAQTEKVESITLPYDYNDILGNPLANETIIEVVKSFQRQAYDEHNAELFRVSTEWNQKVVALSNFAKETNDSLKAEKAELQQLWDAEMVQAQKDAIEIANLTQQVAQLQQQLHDAVLDKEQALLYRDNAVAQLGERQDVINSQAETILGLQQELTAKKALTVNGNDKLAELASKAKESTIEKANRGLQRWGLPTLDIPSMPAEPLAMPEITAAQEGHPTDEIQTTDSGTDQTTDRNATQDKVVEQNPAAEETLTLESLKAEIDALKTAHEVTALTVARIAEKANLPIAV